ncbi:MAG TPA: hypothetical protein VGM76_11135 [Lacipirellulaceae bacterium]|jgi:hypothetical protein
MKTSSQPDLISNQPYADHIESWRGHWRWLTEPDGKTWLLPLTGLWIIGLDWLLFSEEIVTIELATPVIATVGFLLGAIGTYRLQRKFAGDQRGWAWLKAIVAGIVVGLPLPLAGTVVGAWVLAQSGLHGLKNRLLATIRK